MSNIVKKEFEKVMEELQITVHHSQYTQKAIEFILDKLGDISHRVNTTIHNVSDTNQDTQVSDKKNKKENNKN